MASSSRLLLLRRGDHNSRLTEGFESLLDKESMTDVSITCGTQIVKAHRTVLSIFSPFFRRIFDSIKNPTHYPFIVIKDMPYTDLMAIINLMYKGEVTVSQDQFLSLKQSAQTLEVSELSDIITSYEERNDLKPKLDENISSSARNTRRRGRPKRYCQEIDEDFKVFDDITPPTKRQLTARTIANTAIKTITPTAKSQSAARGGANIVFTKQNTGIRMPTAIRGGHSAFSKPQTATRGGHSASLTDTQIVIKGPTKPTSKRNSRGQFAGTKEKDADFDPSQETRRFTARRGRAGRPPRSASLTREDMPLATSLPVSLTKPVDLNLGHIFTNYNLNDVSSSTSTAKPTVAVQFETTIKQEPDSDSEVECILSGTSPLPSGMEEITETIDNSGNEVSNSDSQNPSNPEPNAILESNVDNTVFGVEDSAQIPIESVRNETSFGSVAETNVQPKNIIIKTERIDTPEVTQTEETQESAVSSVRRDSVENAVTNADSSPQSSATINDGSKEATNSVPTVSTINKSTTNIPLLRAIKVERISPSNDVNTSFQTIDNQITDESNSCEPGTSSEPTIPVLTRIKMERISPIDSVNKSLVDITTESEDNTQIANDSTDVSSSHNQDIRVEITKVFTENQSVTQSDAQKASGVTTSDNSECTSSSVQQTGSETNEQISVQNSSDKEVAASQDIAFECFYSSDDQRMQTNSEATAASSSATFTTSGANNYLGFDSTTNPSLSQPNAQTFSGNSNEFSNIVSTNTNTSANQISSSVPTQQYFGVNLTTHSHPTDMSNTSNTFPIDSNNVVMNSPLNSDDECMLLDSPQQSAHFESAIGSEPNDDSMDNL